MNILLDFCDQNFTHKIIITFSHPAVFFHDPHDTLQNSCVCVCVLVTRLKQLLIFVLV